MDTNLKSRRLCKLYFVLPAFFFLILMTGCVGKTDKIGYFVTDSTENTLRSMDYTVQVGAYSSLSNAIKVTENLEKLGLDAFYFRNGGGLYKVRFGNFSSKRKAEGAAKTLLSKDIIDSYYIVKPEEYARTNSRGYTTDNLRRDIVKTAEGFIGLPYRWGSSSPDKGFDCSGLAMAVYQINGLNLPRSTKDQYTSGIPIARGRLKRGDLVFFKISSGRRVSHVGVYIGEKIFIHAPGKGKTIRTDSLSNGYFNKRYVGGRSYIR